MSTDDGPGWEMSQMEQEREQQEAEDALQWWEVRQLYQSYGTQQGMTTAPDLESNYGIRESSPQEIETPSGHYRPVGFWEDPWSAPHR